MDVEISSKSIPNGPPMDVAIGDVSCCTLSLDSITLEHFIFKKNAKRIICKITDFMKSFS